jgi:hypothetical protein
MEQKMNSQLLRHPCPLPIQSFGYGRRSISILLTDCTEEFRLEALVRPTARVSRLTMCPVVPWITLVHGIRRQKPSHVTAQSESRTDFRELTNCILNRILTQLKYLSLAGPLVPTLRPKWLNQPVYSLTESPLALLKYGYGKS